MDSLISTPCMVSEEHKGCRAEVNQAWSLTWGKAPLLVGREAKRWGFSSSETDSARYLGMQDWVEQVSSGSQYCHQTATMSHTC